jgi:hypothetical protein
MVKICPVEVTHSLIPIVSSMLDAILKVEPEAGEWLSMIQDHLVLVSPPPSQTQVHRSIRLKVKGLTGGSKSHFQSLSSSPLMQ